MSRTPGLSPIQLGAAACLNAGIAGAPPRLAAHIRACRDGDWVVFLDLKRDRYSAFPFRSEDAATWQGLGVGGLDAATSPQAFILLQTLQQRDYVLSAAGSGRGFALLQVAPPWAALLFCFAWARWIVRNKRLDRAVAALANWKARIGEGRADGAIVANYERARPWFPERRVCLYDSLSLLAFMLSRGVRADLVVGVSGRPFSAHCWVEKDSVILNSPHDACDGLVEIMRV
ncbi:MAG: lasso peptide biosynthesis B2 protein [Hyphomonadaceae bacterium JAD_PAG50586_4]|nr:MAG: lasso peptide biosynthesis B2 protein [Hyphomonadaceae bacterium JAD_PAG50586_4]